MGVNMPKNVNARWRLEIYIWNDSNVEVVFE